MCILANGNRTRVQLKTSGSITHSHMQLLIQSDTIVLCVTPAAAFASGHVHCRAAHPKVSPFTHLLPRCPACFEGISYLKFGLFSSFKLQIKCLYSGIGALSGFFARLCREEGLKLRTVTSDFTELFFQAELD